MLKSDRSHASRDDGGPDLLVFVHIPKTAGTTLVSSLARRYPPDAVHKMMMRGMSWVAPGRSMLPRLLISPSKVHRLRSALCAARTPQLVHGHFDVSLCRAFPRNAHLVTLLRDPVERAISHYWHYRSLTTDPSHELAMRVGLADWVCGCGLVEMDNGQTRRLAGEMTLPVGAVTRETLAQAKANLAARFSVIGLTERFDEFQVLLYRKLGWPYCRSPARNVGVGRPRKSDLDVDTLEAIRRRNALDFELVRFARGLFERAIAGLDMDRELALLRSAPEQTAPFAPPTRLRASGGA